ncbi:MAG: ABC transporter ATP-binding protein [Aquificaceae bacterium]
MESPVIELINVKKIIRGEEILKGISLRVYKREFVAIMGPSGSGKSSMLYIMGLLDRPTFGDVLFKDQRIDFQRGEELSKVRNESIGFVFQFHYLLPEFTLLENVMVPMLKRGTHINKAKEKAHDLLSRLDLKGKENRKIYQISGGEMQRVAIARALANEPEIFLADEPTGNLDSKNTQVVMDIFQEINATGKTIVMVTHDVQIAKKAKRIVKMEDGQVIG